MALDRLHAAARRPVQQGHVDRPDASFGPEDQVENTYTGPGPTTRPGDQLYRLMMFAQSLFTPILLDESLRSEIRSMLQW